MPKMYRAIDQKIIQYVCDRGYLWNGRGPEFFTTDHEAPCLDEIMFQHEFLKALFQNVPDIYPGQPGWQWKGVELLLCDNREEYIERFLH